MTVELAGTRKQAHRPLRHSLGELVNSQQANRRRIVEAREGKKRSAGVSHTGYAREGESRQAGLRGGGQLKCDSQSKIGPLPPLPFSPPLL